MCRNSLDLFAGFLQKNITCLLSTFTTMCWDIQDGSDPRCSKGDRWIWSPWVIIHVHLVPLGGMVEFEFRSLDVYFCILSTTPNGCPFSPGQAFGTSESLVRFENKGLSKMFQAAVGQVYNEPVCAFRLPSMVKPKGLTHQQIIGQGYWGPGHRYAESIVSIFLHTKRLNVWRWLWKERALGRHAQHLPLGGAQTQAQTGHWRLLPWLHPHRG